MMRNDRDPLLDVFDLPFNFASVASRDTTTSPIQSLHLFNSQTMIQHAKQLAEHAKNGSSIALEHELENAIPTRWSSNRLWLSWVSNPRLTAITVRTKIVVSYKSQRWRIAQARQSTL
jgi:hypothetical protein